MVGYTYMNLNFKKSGYTLAEVLVTISLIGVLATLTLATIGSSVQQRARLAEFRTAYSYLDNALKSVNNDAGRIYNCHLVPSNAYRTEFGLRIEGTVAMQNTECNVLIKEIAKGMGLMRTCEHNPVTEGCLPANYPSNGNAYWYSYNSNGRFKTYVLDNSMIIIQPNNTGIIAIDVNGRKGPNKWGHDIFPLELNITESKLTNGRTTIVDMGFLPPTGAGGEVQNPGHTTKTTAQMMRESTGVR